MYQNTHHHMWWVRKPNTSSGSEMPVRTVSQKLVTLAESGHPVFRATSPLFRGVLESEGGGKLSIHYCADLETIETVFRTVISVNQLSIYGTVAEMCEEYEPCHDRTGDPLWKDSRVKTNILLNDDPAHEEFLLQKDTKNELKSYHNKIEWFKFVLMQDSWQRLTSDSTPWQKTLNSSHNLQNQWLVVSTLCREMKTYLTRKVGFEGTPKLGPYWKSQTASLKVNMEGKLELNR